MTDRTRIRGRWTRRLTPVAAMATIMGASVAMTGVSSATVVAVKGSAYGVNAPNIVIFGGHQTPYGPKPSVALPANGSSTALSATDPSENVTYGPATFFQSGPITVTTQGTAALGFAKSTTAISNETQPAGSCPGTQTSCIYNGPFTADALSSTSIATRSGVTTSLSITNGQLVTATDPNTGNPITTVTIPANPPPNYTVSGYLYPSANDKETFTYIFNQQVTNADGSVTVNIGHEIMYGPTATGDVTFGQTVVGVTNV